MFRFRSVSTRQWFLGKFSRGIITSTNEICIPKIFTDLEFGMEISRLSRLFKHVVLELVRKHRHRVQDALAFRAGWFNASKRHIGARPWKLIMACYLDVFETAD